MGPRSAAQHPRPPRTPARRPGAWAGLLNTHFFIDRTTGICASIYTNTLPFITEHEAWKLYQDFEASLYAAL